MSELFRASSPLARGSTMAEQAADILRQKVMCRVWPVGAMLPSETALAQDMNVSRTVVREAVSRLKAEGLLANRQGRGAFVSSDRPQKGFAIEWQEVENLRKLSQILELRIGLEVEAAAIAATRADAAQIEEIHRAAEMFETDSASGTARVSADLRFHRAVSDATGNDYYLNLFNYLGASLHETMLVGRLQAIKRGGDSSEAVHEHCEIAEAIERRDPACARDRMRVHLELSSARLLGQLQPSRGVAQ